MNRTFAILADDDTVTSIVELPDDGSVPDGRWAKVRPGQAVEPGWIASPDGTFAPRVVVLTPLQFISRLTIAEKVAIAQASVSDPSVAVWQMTMLAAGEIRSDDSRTEEGLAFAVAKGLLTAERAQAVMT